MTQFNYLEAGKRTINLEKLALNQLENRIDNNFNTACDLLFNCTGRVVVTGVGKSGHIARKMAATFASTGTPSFYIHPTEANHGDLGMVTNNDIIVAISNSGASTEIISLLPLFKRQGNKVITLTGKPNSAMAEAADVVLSIHVEKEACPLNLAPTSSTTVTVALGDALAVALLEARGFTEEDFAFSHPGGSLGKKLLLRVSDIMHNGTDIPQVSPDTPLREALTEMTGKGLGMTTVTDEKGQLIGIFTDGDLRRCIEKNIDINKVSTASVMTAAPKTVNRQMLAAQALKIMETHKITALVIENDDHEPVGVLHMHDLLRAGIV